MFLLHKSAACKDSRAVSEITNGQWELASCINKMSHTVLKRFSVTGSIGALFHRCF